MEAKPRAERAPAAIATALSRATVWATSRPALSLWVWCGALALLFFGHALANGLALAPTDILYGYQPWQTLVPKGFQAHNVVLGDVVTAYIPWWAEARRLIGEGHLPVYTPRAFLGMPLFGNLQSGLLFPANWPAFLLPPVPGLALAAALKLMLGGVGFGLWARAIRLSLPAAALGAAAFMFSGPVVVWAQAPVASVFVCLPWALWALERWLGAGRLLSPWIAAVALAVGVQFLGGHPETSFNLLAVVSLYAFVAIALAGELGKSVARRAGGLLLFGGSVLLGAGVAAVQLLPFAILLPKSGQWWTRSYGGTGHLEIPLAYLQGWLVPNFKGNPVHHNYRGLLNYTEQTTYAGLLMLVAAPLAWFGRNWRVVFWTGLALLSIGFAYDLPGFGAVHGLPLVNISNSVRWQAIASFAVIVLGTMGLQAVIDRLGSWESQRWVVGLPEDSRVEGGMVARERRVVTMAPVLVLAAGVISAIVLVWRNSYSTGDRREYLLGWTLWAIFLVCMVGSLLLVASRIGRPMRGVWWATVAMLLLADLWGFGISYNTAVPLTDYYPRTELTDQLAALPPDEPVIAQGADIFPSTALVYNIHDFRTLDDAVNHRFTMFITDASMMTAKNPVWQSFGLVSRPNAAMLAQVGVKYFAAEPGLDPNRGQAKGPRGRPYALRWQGSQGHSIWENIYTAPYSYFPQRVLVVHDEDACRARMRKLKYEDVGQMAIVETAKGQAAPPAGKGVVRKVVREAGLVTADVEVQESKPAALVVNEGIEGGWRASIDNAVAEIYPANYLAQAVVVPPGKHRVVLDYSPPSLRFGALFTVVALVICGLIFALPRLLGTSSLSREERTGE
ncbi:MAG: hypothetical protein ACJ78Q_02220 [Chloroflexia bacterium]